MTDLFAELLPCPFCGGEAELTYQPCELPGFDGKSWSASCRGDVDPDCFASTYAQFKTREYAIDGWNTRHQSAEIAQAVRDAERYHIVRCGDYGIHARIQRGEATEYAWDEDLDQAIDDAMRGGGE